MYNTCGNDPPDKAIVNFPFFFIDSSLIFIKNLTKYITINKNYNNI